MALSRTAKALAEALGTLAYEEMKGVIDRDVADKVSVLIMQAVEVLTDEGG